jgi:hypothetical protein
MPGRPVWVCQELQRCWVFHAQQFSVYIKNGLPPKGHPVNLTELWEAWASIPVEHFRHLVESMLRRIEAVLRANGATTQYKEGVCNVMLVYLNDSRTVVVSDCIYIFSIQLTNYQQPLCPSVCVWFITGEFIWNHVVPSGICILYFRQSSPRKQTGFGMMSSGICLTASELVMDSDRRSTWFEYALL